MIFIRFLHLLELFGDEQREITQEASFILKDGSV